MQTHPRYKSGEHQSKADDVLNKCKHVKISNLGQAPLLKLCIFLSNGSIISFIPSTGPPTQCHVWEGSDHSLHAPPVNAAGAPFTANSDGRTLIPTARKPNESLSLAQLIEDPGSMLSFIISSYCILMDLENFYFVRGMHNRVHTSVKKKITKSTRRFPFNLWIKG